MVRVWFNHWFSTAYNIMELMREGGDICVVGSSRNPYAVLQGACDEWYAEPDISGREYVDFCLSFCKEHSRDVFVPRREMTEISRCISEFEAVGVKVMAERYELVSLLADKRKTYEYFRGTDGINVPEYRIFTDRAGFEACYGELHERFERLCVKFAVDEGALSFRKITERRNIDLRCYVSAEVTYDELCGYLDEHGGGTEIMLMPYFPGTEISADCFAADSGLVAVPRFKSFGRHEFIRYDEGILAACEAITARLKPQFSCNIQFRMLNDTPYLLEINPRMSGGIQMSTLASGVNIPRLALDRLLGRETRCAVDRKECTVSHIERPCIISAR